MTLRSAIDIFTGLIIMHFANSVVWVTGGASGLGAACAELAASSGATVVVFDLADEQPASIDNMIGKVSYYSCDVSKADQVESATKEAQKAVGTPRVLVNCAGIAPACRTVSRKGAHDPSLFRKAIEVNLMGSYFMASTTAAMMSESTPQDSGERGVIINTASVAAFDGQIGQCAYAASKAGIAGMTLPLARDLASLGIRACAIAPGIFLTPMLSGMPDDVQSSLAAQVPFPSRLGQPQEFARLVEHIVNNEMLNGEVIRLDGAIRMGPR